MTKKGMRFVTAFINIFLICVLTALRFSGVATFKIGGAVPIIVLPLIVSIAMFFGVNASFLAALFAGILTDSMSSDTSCFNTLFFAVCVAVCNILVNRYLNRNIKSAVCMSSIVSLSYFFLKYLIFFAFNSISVNYDYFMLYLIPSVVYTAVFIIPFYFLEKYLVN